MSTRYLFALDFLAPHLPPEKDSKRDIQLLRAANLASQRHRSGIEDMFLFIVYGACDQRAITGSLRSYGFPSLEVRFVAVDHKLSCDDSGRVPWDQDNEDEINDELRRWVETDHPASLPLYLVPSTGEGMTAYRELPWRWVGLAANNSTFGWPFDTDAFGKLLPSTHTRRAETWLALLQEGSDLNKDDIECNLYESFRATAQATALCEWLHGFEAASGNSYNDFDPAHAAEKLGMNDVLLGYEAASTQLESAMAALQEAETEEAIRAAAVLAVTEKYRYDVLSALTIIGEDSALFFTLYASIWPRYDVRLEEAADAVLGLEEVDYGEVEAAWRFVQDGWHENADADY